MTPLELLAESNNCFISDLRYRAVDELDFGLMLESSACTELEKWREVMDYIFPHAPPFQTVEEIKADIRRRIGAGTADKR